MCIIMQVEVKSSDNNWIKCYRCSFQYCHLCGEPCFGLYHFSTYGCKRISSLKEDIKLKKQHNDDDNGGGGDENTTEGEQEEEGGLGGEEGREQ